jgi:hypothetical protein
VFSRSTSKGEGNYLDNVPRRTVDFEEGEAGRLVLLRPKFLTGPFAKWLQPHLPKKHFRVQLDDIGTLAWKSIDGSRTVGEIAEILYAEFGERVEPRYERCSKFVHSLHQGAMVAFVEPPRGGGEGS